MSETGNPPETAMRADWNRRAEEDHKLHIATGHARSEEDFRASGEKDLIEGVLDGIELSPHAEALEIGCGVGRLLVPLSTRIAAAHGVDISGVMIGKSKEYCAERPNVTTRVTDGALEAFGEGSLDFVYSFIVFQHIPFREAIATYVREAGRVLAPGGLLRFQVDGHWRERSSRKADTYDGVVFSPEEVRTMVQSAGLSVVEEWGEETHYHWVTARKPGDGTGRASFHPRTYDAALLLDLIGSLGVAQAAEQARNIAAGDRGMRSALGHFEDAFAALPNGEFVEEILRSLLGHAPDPAGVAYHTRILDGGFEDRASMVDTVLSGSEFRQLVRPRVPRAPWPRLVTLAGPGDLLGFFEVVDTFVERMRGLSPAEVVDEGFRLLANHSPDAESHACNTAFIGGSVYGLRLFVRQLLPSPDGRAEPGPLEPGRADAVLARLGARGAPGAPQTVESFPGEAVAAARFLATTSALEPADFVRVAYETVLGRAADEGGHVFYAGHLAGGSMSRAEVLRELLWSEELRAV